MNQKREVRTVSLIGLGAIGCFLASHLGPLMGDNLRVIAGGSRRERLEQEGVMVNGVRHHFNIVSPEETCGQDYPDLAIIITKFPALSQALEDMRNQIGPDTLIMAPLNGVEAEEKVAAVYGWDNLLYSLAKVSVVMKDGCASFNPKAARIEMGEKHNETVSPRVQAVKELFEGAGIRTVVPEDMERAIWYKYMCNVSENQSAAVLGIPFGAWSVSADANFIREKLMREVIAIAQKKGIWKNRPACLRTCLLKINRPPSRTLRQAARPRWKCSEAPSSVWAVSWECLRLIMKCSTMELRCWSRRMRGCFKKNTVSPALGRGRWK